MSILPPSTLDSIRTSYANSYEIDLTEVTLSGFCSGLDDPVSNLPALSRTRATGLQEAFRWGEPYSLFLLPNVISWIVPLVKDARFLGGLCGGAVLAEPDPSDRFETINYLASSGCTREQAEVYVNALPVWTNPERPQKAAEFLFALTCNALSWDMLLLSENRKKAMRQREIAEEIHRRKQGGGEHSLIDEERALFSLMKAGDQKGARRELNKTLGALFTHTADIRLIKAHVIEMMGYLVRSAIEDSPHMSSLIEKNHEWMTTIIDAGDFETLANVMADALDGFMRNIYLLGQNRTNTTVSRILNYISEHAYDPITLDMIAEEVNLSTFRISHLVKEQTGKTVFQHIQQLRIQEAQRLLEQSDLCCTDIAYETGFCDQSYFIKQFRRQMGITPARYRRLYLSHQASDHT
ncbi:MAG: helix-turn-helix domain-containing protein [Verrucomicrobia bacterium]|jgi:two-component system, response regulator YesN|nr:helix-turn-helix domain-containing protein [Verrucomicrobiota bacterium]